MFVGRSGSRVLIVRAVLVVSSLNSTHGGGGGRGGGASSFLQTCPPSIALAPFFLTALKGGNPLSGPLLPG
jgi:hypothetical protein